MRDHDCEISSGLRAFGKEILWKSDGSKISEYQGKRLSTLFEWLARICRREARHWIGFCLEKVVNDAWNEKCNAFFYLTDCFYSSHKKVDPIVPSTIERNALLKT